MDPLKSTYFIVLRTLQTLSDILGLVLFGALFLITIKHRKLHSTCHLLIGFFSLFTIFSKLSTLLPYLFYMIPDLYHICANIGLWLQFMPIILRYGIHPMMFLIGVDRLLSVLFPIWYATRENKLYLPFMLSIPATFLTFVIFIAVKDIQTQTNIEIFMANFNDRNPIIITCLIYFVALTFFCYLFMFIKILYAQNGNSSIRQAIYKSLGLIVLIQIGGWLILLISRIMVANLELVPKTFIINCFSTFISFATNSEVILLYYTSNEHRRAFQKTFGFLFRLISKLNISIISPASAPNGMPVNLNLNGLSNLNSPQNILCTTNI